MPRYFFHIANGKTFKDDLGELFLGTAEAMAHAVDIAKELGEDAGWHSYSRQMRPGGSNAGQHSAASAHGGSRETPKTAVSLLWGAAYPIARNTRTRRTPVAVPFVLIFRFGKRREQFEAPVHPTLIAPAAACDVEL
jgi:hypothetical protein